MPNKGNETCHIFVNRIPPPQIKTEEKLKIFFFFTEILEILIICGFVYSKCSWNTSKSYGKMRSMILNKGMIIQ